MAMVTDYCKGLLSRQLLMYRIRLPFQPAYSLNLNHIHYGTKLACFHLNAGVDKENLFPKLF
jgi:hypothetical protein